MSCKALSSDAGTWGSCAAQQVQPPVAHCHHSAAWPLLHAKCTREVLQHVFLV